MGGVAAGKDVPGENRDAADIVEQQRGRSPGDTERRERADSEDEQRRQRNQQEHPAAHHQGWDQHVSGASDDAGEAVHDP